MSFSSANAPATDPSATGPGEGKTAFVTVGTTEFDSLIRALDDPSVYALFARAGFTRLVVQMGRGQYEPLHRESAPSSLAVDVYRFKPSITPDVARADLVIGHAGAGTALEVRVGRLVAQERLSLALEIEVLITKYNQKSLIVLVRAFRFAVSIPTELTILYVCAH